MVTIIVVWPERLQVEPGTFKNGGSLEVVRDEGV